MKYIFGLLFLVLVPRAEAIRQNTTWETDCTWNQTYSKIGVPGSTVAVNGIGISYMIYANGGTADYYIKHTTKTYGGTLGVGVTVSSVTTATISITSGAVLTDEFKALTINPAIIIQALGASATAHVYIDYCEGKK